MTINELNQAILSVKARSAWSRGVKLYAMRLTEKLDEAIQGGYFAEDKLTDHVALEKQMLNGARDWTEYSWGGNSLIYDSYIARRLCSPSELKKTRNGERKPNSREEWLDTQARALYQAAILIMRLTLD